MRVLALVAALAAALPAFAHDNATDGRDIDRVNRGITVDANSRYGELSTVNGGITIGEGAEVETAETVNGGIRVGARAIVDEVETVNGGVVLREGAIVRRDVEAVNGGIRLAADAEVGGDLSNVNGGIELERARVGGIIETVQGDIEIGAGSRVEGGIRVEKPTGAFMKGWFGGPSRPPRVVIGADAYVGGELVFEHEVELHVHETAKIGRVTGAEAKRYSGDRAPL